MSDEIEQPEIEQPEPTLEQEFERELGDGDEDEDEPAGRQSDPGELGERLREKIAQEDADPDPDESEPAQPPATAVVDDDAVLKLEKEKTRHVRALEKLLGPEVPLVECDRCEGQGVLPPWMVEEQPDLEYPEDTHRQRCVSCQGLGGVQTGSRVQGQEVLVCLDCRGRGWTGDAEVDQANGSDRVVEQWDPAWGPPPVLPSAAS